MTYRIEENRTYNTREVYFDGKPAEAVRAALKDLSFRWHSLKKCWYGYAAESEIISAILGAGTESEPASVVTDGYLGGGAIYGSKSNLHLYGAELAKAIRNDIKSAGIKGVTIASRHGNIQATFKTVADDVVTEGEFIAAYNVKGSFGWVDYTDKSGTQKTVSVCDYYNLPREEREAIRIEYAKREYLRDYAKENHINHYHIDKYNGFTPGFLAKMKCVLTIIEAYRYDESNSMVDYFNTNFYISLYTKPEGGTKQ